MPLCFYFEYLVPTVSSPAYSGLGCRARLPSPFSEPYHRLRQAFPGPLRDDVFPVCPWFAPRPSPDWAAPKWLSTLMSISCTPISSQMTKPVILSLRERERERPATQQGKTIWGTNVSSLVLLSPIQS